jgi:uncharacterized protein (DUF924 family)
MTAATYTPADVLSFWREAGPERWFTKNDAFDREIRNRFGQLHAEAAAGKHDAWAETPEGGLALLILFDQFSRNLFRGSAETFSKDDTARAIARDSISRGFDKTMDSTLRRFFYLPLRHSEQLADHDLDVRMAHALGDLGQLKYARHHRDIVRRFGRFPHRNAILGRHTTPAEQAFLDGGGFSG